MVVAVGGRGRDKEGVDGATAAAGTAGARHWTVAGEAVRPAPRFGAPGNDSKSGVAGGAATPVTRTALVAVGVAAPGNSAMPRQRSR